MKNSIWILLAAPAWLLACGDDSTSSGSGGAGSGGAAGTSSTTVGSTSTSSGTTSTATSTTSGPGTGGEGPGTGGEGPGTGGGGPGTGGGGPADCSDILTEDECATCLEDSCCGELAACDSTDGCLECLTEDEDLCTDDNAEAVDSLVACLNTACAEECGAAPPVEPTCDVPADPPSAGACVTLDDAITCNPVTNEPCGAGEACDTNGDGYECYEPPNDAVLCEECGDNNFCAGGLTCAGTCAKYCCTDEDCGAGICDFTTGVLGGVGVCTGGN